MLQFSCRFAFLSAFRLLNWTPKLTRIVTLYQANAATLMPFSRLRKAQFWSNICMNIKVTMVGSL